MRYLYYITFTLLFCSISLSSLHAQDIDQERMQRDLNIMESVLEELFKSEWSAKDGTGTIERVEILTKGLSWAPNKNNTVEGNYFPDYGTIFMITSTKPVIMRLDGNENTRGYFSSAGNEGNVEINRSSVINRISEFLMDYGSLIKQLEPSDNVTVVYKANNVDQLFTIVRNDSLNKQVDTKSVPSVSVSALERDLQAYRKGEINESTFTERLNISDLNPEGQSERKLRIMSKILQTTFEDDESDNFEIDDIDHLYLEGFGAIFEGKASHGSTFFGFSVNFPKLRKRLKELALRDSLSVSFSSENFSWSSEEDGFEEKSPKEVKSAYDNFLETLQETLIDYGQTLTSVQADEHILISLSLSSAGGEMVPEQLELRIKKSVLEAVADGDMSREQAIVQIKTIEKYRAQGQQVEGEEAKGEQIDG